MIEKWLPSLTSERPIVVELNMLHRSKHRSKQHGIFSDLKLQVNSESDPTGCCFWFREAYDTHLELQPLHCLPKQERPALQSGEDSFSFRPPARQESALSGQKRCVDGVCSQAVQWANLDDDL